MNTDMMKKLMLAHEKHGKPFCVSVKGVSMLPLLKNGDVITVKRQDKYKTGDILIFEYGEGTAAHRLLKKTKRQYIFKGDNTYNLESIEPEKILGKAIYKMEDNNEKSLYPHWLKLRLICLLSLSIHRKWLKVKYVAPTQRSWRYRMYRWVYPVGEK